MDQQNKPTISVPIAGACRMFTRSAASSVLLVLASANTASAVPYAAQVSRTGDTINWVLNEHADKVMIARDGGDVIVLNDVDAGAHSFEMAGYSSYSIEVVNDAPYGWTESPVSLDNPLMTFKLANGIAVNNNPLSENFGRFYVSQRAATTANNGRLLGDGIYAFNADGTDINGITDPNDTSAALQAGLESYFAGTSSSPFRIEVDRDDNLLIGDWSDASGGMYITDADVTNGRPLLANPGGDTPLPAGQNHGSIISTPVVTGSFAEGNLTLWTIDEDMQSTDPDTAVDSVQHIWRYDIGSDPGDSGYRGSAVLEVDISLIGPNGDGTNSDGSRILFPDVPGVDSDLTYDPVHDNFIVTQRRSDGNETGLLIFDGDFSTILFNSRQFSLDNNLDGAEDDLLIVNFDGIQDIFRATTSAVVSPDGSFIVLSRSLVGNNTTSGINDFFGPNEMLVVELDADGVPVLDLTDAANAVNGDYTQQDIMLGAVGINTGGGFRVPVAIDLAGNIYTTSSDEQRAYVYSPGGYTTNITSSDGFNKGPVIWPPIEPIPGDLNDDGFVGLDDLDIILQNWNQIVDMGKWFVGDPSGDGFVGLEDLDFVLNHWNEGMPPIAVPEPATALLLTVGLLLYRRNS